jgi:hypothetical protein
MAATQARPELTQSKLATCDSINRQVILSTFRFPTQHKAINLESAASRRVVVGFACCGFVVGDDLDKTNKEGELVSIAERSPMSPRMPTKNGVLQLVVAV